jgi:hypothetical protein
MEKYICEHCTASFDKFQQKANHIRWEHMDNSNLTDKLSKATTEYYNKLHGEKQNYTLNCKKCNNGFNVLCRKKDINKHLFCSRSCANSRGKRSLDFKQKVSEKIKKHWKDGTFDHIVELTTNTTIFSSKVEREIVKYFKDNHKSDGWKSGGPFKFENEFIVRDLYSDKLKVCFEYDGIWHFKDIKNQLKNKQYKDFLLEKWCSDNNYKLIRIQEGYFESFEMLEKLIYEDSRKLIKIGKGYV